MTLKPRFTDDPKGDPKLWSPAFAKIQALLPAGGTITTQASPYTGLPDGYMAESGHKAKPIKDAAGQITFSDYDLTKDSNVILGSMDEVTRNRVLTELYKRGGYSSGKPGNGFSDRDRAAFSDLLLYSNVKGIPWNAAFYKFQKDVPIVSGQGVGRAPAITPRQDVARSVDSAAIQELGRKFTDQVTGNLVKQIQGREAGGDKTSLGSMSVAAAGKVAPDEAEAYKFAQYAQVFERLLGK